MCKSNKVMNGLNPGSGGSNRIWKLLAIPSANVYHACITKDKNVLSFFIVRKWSQNLQRERKISRFKIHPFRFLREASPSSRQMWFFNFFHLIKNPFGRLDMTCFRASPGKIFQQLYLGECGLKNRGIAIITASDLTYLLKDATWNVTKAENCFWLNLESFAGSSCLHPGGKKRQKLAQKASAVFFSSVYPHSPIRFTALNTHLSLGARLGRGTLLFTRAFKQIRTGNKVRTGRSKTVYGGISILNDIKSPHDIFLKHHNLLHDLLFPLLFIV